MIVNRTVVDADGKNPVLIRDEIMMLRSPAGGCSLHFLGKPRGESLQGWYRTFDEALAAWDQLIRNGWVEARKTVLNPSQLREGWTP